MKKTTITTTFAALLLGASGLQAQSSNTAYTKPSGFVTHTLKAGQFNLIGLTLHEAVTVAGSFSAVSSTILSDDDVDFDAVLTSGKSYILEVTSGSLDGTIQVITQWSGNDLTTQDSLIEGIDKVAIGDSFQLREAPTLEAVFGTTDSVLKKGAVSRFADVVWVPDGQGGYAQYYLSTSNEWKNAVGNVLAPNVSIIYSDAIFVQRKGEDVNLVLTGSVKSVDSSVVLSPGFNPVSVVYPVGSTLQNSGLDASLKAGAAMRFADVVWVPDGAGSYSQYYFHTTNVWRDAANVTVSADIVLPSGIFVQRKGDAVEAKVTPPDNYSNL